MKIQIHSQSPEASEGIALPQILQSINFNDIRAPSARAVALIGEGHVQLCISSSETALLSYHPRRAMDECIRNDSAIELCLALHHKHIRGLVPQLSGTKTLTIARPVGASTDGMPSYVFTREDFTSFTSLLHLTITGADLHATLPLLGVREGDDPATILFPALQSLSVGGSTVWSLISALPKYEPTQTIAGWLYAILRSRWEKGNKSTARLYLHIHEELVNIAAERWELTSCSKYLANVAKVVKDMPCARVHLHTYKRSRCDNSVQ